MEIRKEYLLNSRIGDYIEAHCFFCSPRKAWATEETMIFNDLQYHTDNSIIFYSSKDQPTHHAPKLEAPSKSESALRIPVVPPPKPAPMQPAPQKTQVPQSNTSVKALQESLFKDKPLPYGIQKECIYTFLGLADLHILRSQLHSQHSQYSHFHRYQILQGSQIRSHQRPFSRHQDAKSSARE
jgi:hypothetical protein